MQEHSYKNTTIGTEYVGPLDSSQKSEKSDETCWKIFCFVMFVVMFVPLIDY